MAEETVAPAAPAQSSAETAAVSATDAAVASDSTSSYREARRAERAGKPLPSVNADAAPAQPATDGAPATPAAPAQPTVSKRQQTINDYERRIAEQDQRIRALESGSRPAAPAEPAAPAQPAAATVPEWKRIAALPDAPKIDDFESLGEHAAAMALFVNHTLQTEAQTRTHGEQLTAAQVTRVETFITRLNEAKVADPTFVSKLTPDVRALKPFSALAPGEQGGPRNVIAEQVYDSPISPKVLIHLSEHPEALAKLETMPDHIKAMPAAMRNREHIKWIVKEFGKLEGSLESPSAPAAPQPKTLTDAAEPAQTLGTRAAEATDPKARAIRTGSTSAYRQARREERAAALRR